MKLVSAGRTQSDSQLEVLMIQIYNPENTDFEKTET